MKNGDKNAYPIKDCSNGLTKRELFIAMAMQGLCAGDHNKYRTLREQTTIAEEAILIADEVLEKLENKK